MNGLQLLEKQFKATNAALHELLEDVSPEVWSSRPAASQNIFAFTTWHVPRTQDNFVHTWIRGIPEIITRERWRNWHAFGKSLAGIGIPLSEADRIAGGLRKEDVLDYSDQVTKEIVAWLQTLSDADLDRVPEYSGHLAPFPEYRTRGYKADTDHLLDQPLWRLLSGTCILHVRGHLGELQLEKGLQRRQ